MLAGVPATVLKEFAQIDCLKTREIGASRVGGKLVIFGSEQAEVGKSARERAERAVMLATALPKAFL